VPGGIGGGLGREAEAKKEAKDGKAEAKAEAGPLLTSYLVPLTSYFSQAEAQPG
jgi:hypothetical protein